MSPPPPPPPPQPMFVYYKYILFICLWFWCQFPFHTHTDAVILNWMIIVINEYFRCFKPEGKELLLMNGYTQHCSNILHFGCVHFLTRFEFTQNVWFAVVCVSHKMQLQSVNFTKYLKIGCVCVLGGGGGGGGTPLTEKPTRFAIDHHFIISTLLPQHKHSWAK